MVDQRTDPLRVESRAVAELAQLHGAPVFYGRGAPRGDHRLVVVVPGLFGNDVYLGPLRGWLRRIGYTPVRSSLAINAGCPNRLRGEVERSIDRQLRQTPGPVALIGHSRGGMLCWALASRLQERASHLALLGSPAPAVVAMMRQQAVMEPHRYAHSSVAAAGARATKLFDPDCDVPACGCDYTKDLARPLHPATRVLAIYSRDDPIVRPAACRVWSGENVEVGGSHSGLSHNRDVYPHLARFLASR
jgi:pimeloyl-ACP methyl ester carboxylesterase